MVKLTDEQKAMLEALDKIPDDEIDFSDIPERPIDWSKAKIAPFYRPVMKDFSLKLDEYAIDGLASRLADGQALDEAVNKALLAQMFRIRFPVRVQKAEKTVGRIQEAPEEIESLIYVRKQEIEILYAMPIAEVASSGASLKRADRPKSGPRDRPVVKDISLKLDENVIDWFEERLEEGQSRDEAVNKALMDHIHWVRFPKRVEREEEAAGKAEDSA